MAATKGSKPSTAVTKAEARKTAVSTGMDVDLSILMADGAQQQFNRDDLTIPFLKVIQALSPVRQKSKPEYIKGADEGMFLNTATKKLYDGEGTGILVVPVAFTRSYTEWNLLEKGGGLVRDHGDNGSLLAACTKDDKGRYVTPSGTELVEAALYYLLVFDEETGHADSAALILKGTQWKKARQWNTLMNKMMVELNGQRFKPAMYYHAWRLTTQSESNDQGSWYGVVVPNEPETTVFELPNGARLYQEARAFAQTIHKGEVKVKLDDLEERGGAGADDDDDAL